MSTRRSFPSTPASVPAARRYALDAIGPVSKPVVEAVAVAVSELATNCVRHAGTDFTVDVERTGERLRVEVADRGGGVPAVQSPNPSESSGRGLMLVRALADEWGVNTRAGRAGKSVWFAIDLAAHPDAEGVSA